MKKLLLITMLLGLSMASYQVGQTVSSADQNITKQTCYAGNEYEIPEDWKLADWNGDINGGNYNVILICRLHGEVPV